MRIALGSDHRGREVLAHLSRSLTQQGHAVHYVRGPDSANTDYPDVAYAVASMVAQGEMDRGILVCGTGLGMSIAANKVPGVRAAAVHDEVTADTSRRHNDANVLCLSADMLGLRFIDRIVTVFLNTDFEGGRHARRVRKIAAIEQGRDPADERDADPNSQVA